MKITKIEHQTNQFLNDVVIKEIEKALFNAFGTSEVTAHTAVGPMDREEFIKKLKQYKDFFDSDYKRRQEQQKRIADSYDSLVHAIEMQKRFEKGLNK
jgi:hypothetical protein